MLFQGPLQSLCTFHHNSTKAQMEKSGRITGCGIDGTPLDPNHAWNREVSA